MKEADACTCASCSRMPPEKPITPKGNTMHKMVSDVRDFHEATDKLVGATPCVPAPSAELRCENLITEEYEELLSAIVRGKLVDIAEEGVDLIYVIISMLHEYGIPVDKVWDAKHAANMAKVDPVTGKVSRRADGKILKPEGWQKPDIAGVMVGGE